MHIASIGTNPGKTAGRTQRSFGAQEVLAWATVGLYCEVITLIDRVEACARARFMGTA